MKKQLLILPILIGMTLFGFSQTITTKINDQSTANKYLTTVTADIDGNWQANLTTFYDYFIATAIDISGNSSQLSNISGEKSSLIKMCDTTEFNNCICSNDTAYYDMSNNGTSPPTLTSISSLSPCLYAGTPMQLDNDATDANIYYWQFGNGDVSYTKNADYTFPTEGYYCITLKVSNNCGSAQYTETMYVKPDNCSCSTAEGGTVVYDIPDGYTITTYETWNSSLYPNGIKVEGDVFIEPNSRLTIDSLTVQFAPKGRIIVEGTGRLRLPNNTILTGLSSCNNMWQGIEVWGDGNDPAISNLNTQGAIHDAKATIENAHIAILLGKRNMDALCDANLDLFDRDYSGGMAKIDDIDFINNGIGIKAIHKQNNYRNYIMVNHCNFSSTTLLDAKYNSNNAIHYPTYSNPFVNASPSGRTTVGMWLDRCDNNTNGASYFDQNTFTNIDTCIKAIDSRINVKRNTFTNASYGFYALNITTSLNSPHIIKENTFDLIHDVQTNQGTGIYMALSQNDVIYDNLLKNENEDINICDNAITMVFSSNYEITENEIKYYKNGINAIWDMCGLIGADAPLWKGNKFLDCEIGINTVLANNNLILKCNDHKPSLSPTQYNVNWNNSGISINWWPVYLNLTLGDQGVNGANTDNPAGNTFNTLLLKQITSNTIYNYYHHGNVSVTNFYRPVLKSGSAPINIIATNLNYVSDAAACGGGTSVWPPMPLSNFNLSVAPYTTIVNMKNANATLQSEYENMMNNIDCGNTSDLLSAINSNMSGGKLKNLLKNNSPLSDDVIMALMAEDALSVGNFKNVMQDNLPVSNALVEDFYTYIENFPQGIKNQLMALQKADNLQSPSGILRAINHLETDYFDKLDKLVDALLDSTNYRKDDAIALLEYDASLKSKQILFGTYLEDKRYADATQKLNEISTLNIDYINDYVLLNQILLNLHQNGLSIYDMDSTDYVFVYNLAHNCPESPAVYQARSIVEIISGEHVSECPIPELRSMKANLSSKSISSKPIELVLGENYPEPLSDYTYIPYTLPNETKGRIIITDILGKIVKTIQVSANEVEIKLQTKNWSAGTYYYSLEVNGNILFTKKMILIR